MKTKIITLLAVMGIAATALLLSCSEKSVTQDAWQSQSVSQELSGLYDTSVPLLQAALSKVPATRSHGGYRIDIQSIEDRIISFSKKYNVIEQAEKAGYYHVKLNKDSLMMVAPNAYALAEYAKDNGTSRYAEIILRFAESGKFEWTQNEIIEDNKLLLAEKISLIMMCVAQDAINKENIHTREGGNPCREQLNWDKTKCTGTFVLNAGVSGAGVIASGGLLAALSAVCFVSAVDSYDTCMDNANAVYKACMESQQK